MNLNHFRRNFTHFKVSTLRKSIFEILTGIEQSDARDVILLAVLEIRLRLELHEGKTLLEKNGD